MQSRSLPARERGSKQMIGNVKLIIGLSLPARERGSKQPIVCRARIGHQVAPRAGARIETLCPRRHRDALCRRSPRGSADRNGTTPEPASVVVTSLPARERGSKLARRCPSEVSQAVAPRAGARIETMQLSERSSLCSSRSPRGSADRNLQDVRAPRSWRPSLPARERGSKLRMDLLRTAHGRVAPRAGARIETLLASPWQASGGGRSPRGSADRNH